MGNQRIPVAMFNFQLTGRLSKKEREMELDHSPLHLLADAAALVSEGKLSLPSSVFDLNGEKKETPAVTTTLGPTCVRWVVRKKRTPRARGPTFHAQKLNSDPVVSKQETWRGIAENNKKRPRALESTETHESDRVSKKPKKNLAALTGGSELPTIFMDKVLEMRGRDVTLVVEKQLSASDMNPVQSRLSVPKSQVLGEFLSDQEIRTLDSQEGIKVSLVDPCLEVHDGLQLKKWNYSSKTFSYVLTNQWNAVAHPHKRNGLKKDGLIRLWSFRVDGNLCFCLTKIEEATVEGTVAPLMGDHHSILGSIL